MVRRDSVEVRGSGEVGGGAGVTLGVGGIGGRMERREWRGRECGVLMDRSPRGGVVRGGRCLRWGQEGL